MKAVITIIALIIIGALAYFFFVSDTDTQMPTENDTTNDTQVDADMPENDMEDADAMEEDDSATTVAEDLSAGDKGDTEGTKVFNIDGFNFDYSVDEIRVEEGDTVTINLTSTDGFHDWVVDEFDAATERVQTGESTSVTFVADQAGTYEFYCSVGQHRQNGMVGTLIVE